jgi:hypothetical protein
MVSFGVYLLALSPSDPLSVTVFGLSFSPAFFYIIPGIAGIVYSLIRTTFDI